MATTIAAKTVFELVSPEKLVLSKPVDMVVVPGAEGLFAAMPGHAPFLATLKPGVIEVYQAGKVEERIFVAGGFAEVTPDRCVVLAEQATPVKDLNRAEIMSRINQLRSVAGLATQSFDVEHSGILAELSVQEAMLLAVDSAA